MNFRFFNFLVVAVVAVTMMFLGCKKSEELSFDVPSDSILIEVNRAGDEGTTSFASHNISAVNVVSTPNGWEVTDIDMYAKTITVKSPATFDDGEVREGTLSLSGYSPRGTLKSVSIHVAILQKPDIDYRNAPANCYVAPQAQTRYLFNAMIGGSTTPLETVSLRLIWQSVSGLVPYIDFEDGVGSFYVEALAENEDEDEEYFEPGNALIGAYDAQGELIWTWHIWVTQSNPADDAITLNGVEMMNRNLGANCNSEGKNDPKLIGQSYGMYYQWGRRTPIVGPQMWNFSANFDMTLWDANGVDMAVKYTESTAETGSVAWAERNPRVIITGNKDNAYDWLYEGHDDSLWSTTSKSEHDPCPAGWRLPTSEVFEDLTISPVDDAMDWHEAQTMYGWRLVDADAPSGEAFFFSAAGRRNYIDGRLDIVNDDDICPVPWAGYYWTATTTDDGKAEAMFFDLNSATRTWNGFDAARSMHRANAMPVRCVRE